MSWYLEEIIYKFVQEGNSNGSTSEEEIITITVESGIDSIEKGGGFLTIRTCSGWSIENLEELTAMLKIVMEGISVEKIE